MNTTVEKIGPRFGLWVLLLGASGFAAGFFGPIILNPDANQGPLTGIFITGPGGAILGALLGVIFRFLPLSARRQWQVLIGSSVILVIATLYICLPAPALRGYVLDVQIRGCKPPAESADAAIAHWEKRIAQVTWSPPRAGWKEDVQRMLRDDPGVVLEVDVRQRRAIYEHRKPWNKGNLTASAWETVNEAKSYFARYDGNSCASYVIGALSMRSPSSRTGRDWPPRELPNFLGLEVLDAVPQRYSTFAAASQ